MKKLTMTALIYTCPCRRCTHMDADGACTAERCPIWVRKCETVEVTFEVPNKNSEE